MNSLQLKLWAEKKRTIYLLFTLHLEKPYTIHYMLYEQFRLLLYNLGLIYLIIKFFLQQYTV